MSYVIHKRRKYEVRNGILDLKAQRIQDIRDIEGLKGVKGRGKCDLNIITNISTYPKNLNY